MTVTIQDLVLLVFASLIIGCAIGVWAAIIRSENFVDDLRQDKASAIAHLEAIGGDEAVVLALADKDIPSAKEALLLAESTYLYRAGWTRSHNGSGWSPPYAQTEVWTHPKAMDRQRWRDSIPPGALDPFMKA